MYRIILVGISVLVTLFGVGQEIQSPAKFLGYEPGSRFTSHHQIVDYFQSLASARPNEVKVERYGVTEEGRPLILVYISSAENIQRLDDIRKNNLYKAGLGEPVKSYLKMPAIVWMSYNV
ncbi:MAG TPA: zinc carboxypeptidase, partial [Parasegetibacter sp.]